MNELWTDLKPYALQALAVVIPAVVAVVLAWLRSVQTRILARTAAVEVEKEAASEDLRGPAKMDRAVNKVRKRITLLTTMSDSKARELIESELPQARKDSDPPRP